MLLVNLLNYIYICLKMTYIYMYKNCFLLSIEKMPGIYTYIYFFPPESSLLPAYPYPV